MEESKDEYSDDICILSYGDQYLSYRFASDEEMVAAEAAISEKQRRDEEAKKQEEEEHERERNSDL